jgi:hypothetical protein
MDTDYKNELEYDYGLQLTDSGIAKLNYYLNYSFPLPLLYFLTYAMGMGIELLMLAAVIFSPYMIYILAKNKKYGWVISFLIMVIIPLMAGFILISEPIWYLILTRTSLGMFYLYCVVLKFSTRDWVADESAKKELYKQRRLRKLEEDIFLGKIKP